MSAEAIGPNEAAPVVAARIDQSESSLLRELVGDEEALREVEMGDDSGSELTELESSVGEAMEVEEEEWEGKNRGRPNFRRAAPGAQRQQSMQEFFRHGNTYGHDDDIFWTPGKQVMRGALARSLTVATSSQQQVGMAETRNAAKSSGQGPWRLDVGASDWAEEVATHEEEMEEAAIDEESETTPTPAPARWPGMPRPVPVTPTKGSKRMAMGTPRPTRQYRPVARPMPVGFAAASALEQILAAIAGVERRMEEKVTVLEARMMEGMGALATDGERLLADTEEREKRLAARLLAIDGIETELAQKAQWEIKQWTDLAELMERRRVEIGEVRKAVEGLAARPTAAPTRAAAAPDVAAGLVDAPEPEAMEGVVGTAAPALHNDPIEDWSDMEGVEREGLHVSQHAPAAGAPAEIPTPVVEGQKKGKGKAKRALIATPPGSARAARQQIRQEKVDRARKAKEEAVEPTATAPPTILKRPETRAAEVKEAEKKKEEAVRKEEKKAAAMKRWEEGELSQEEREVYSTAANPIRNLAIDYEAFEEVAAGQRMAHRVGMRALGDRWEAEWARPRAAPQAPQPQRQQQNQQQRQRQQSQQREEKSRVPQQPQPANWAQRAAAAAALPQSDYRRAGRNGKPEREPTGLELIRGSIPRDERGIIFERTVDAPQIDPAIAASAAAFVNLALSKAAPAHVRTEGFRISVQGRLSTTARFGASAAMLLRFKKEILEAVRKADKAIINVTANETWAEMKILVKYDRYRHTNGLADLREQIEAENDGVVVPPLSIRWMRPVAAIKQRYQAGRLPQNAASVVFKVPGRATAQKLLSEMWVAGNRFRALPFIPDKADTLCSNCSQWGHSEFRCRQTGTTCAICTGSHMTENHKCEVATCGKVGKVCSHTEMVCPNCGGSHPAQDARCRAKRAAIEIARGRRCDTGVVS